MRAWLIACFVVCGLASGCGRLRYEDRACPEDMIELGHPDGGVAFCIQAAQNESYLTYVDASAHCGSLGMRLCQDAEWFQACTSGDATLARMTDDWEWVAELYTETDAYKRGGGGCDLTSTHTIDTDPYGFRCCSAR